MPDDIVEAAFEAFRADVAAAPGLSLRAGDALDSYEEPPAFDPEVDERTDSYLETYAFHGLPLLDPASWRHYLPRLMDHALRSLGDSRSMVLDGLLFSLRPPDRDPPRLASLTVEQEAVIVAFLERLAFSESAVPEHEMALQALEERWILNGIYRPHAGRDTRQEHREERRHGD